VTGPDALLGVPGPIDCDGCVCGCPLCEHICDDDEEETTWPAGPPAPSST
jgi:hypothetical protein